MPNIRMPSQTVDSRTVNTVNAAVSYRFHSNQEVLDAWDISVGAGMAWAVVGGAQMQVGCGVAPNAVFTMRSKQRFTGAHRLTAMLRVNQRIVNQEVRLGLVTADGREAAEFVFNGTTTTTVGMQCKSGNVQGSLAQMTSWHDTSNAVRMYEIENMLDETWFHQRTPNDSTTRALSRLVNLKIPDPNAELFIQLTVINGATAPASNTTLTIDDFLVIALNEVQAEVTGRGEASSGKATAVHIAGSNATLVSQPANMAFNNETTTPLAANATFTGTSRDAGSTPGGQSFAVVAFADQPGNVRIEMSNDNTTWRRATADTAVTAAAPVTLVVPIVTRYYRVVFVNGATAQTAFMVNSRYRFYA